MVAAKRPKKFKDRTRLTTEDQLRARNAELEAEVAQLRCKLMEITYPSDAAYKALEAEVARLKGDPDSYDNTYKRNLEHQRENGRLREEIARLRKELEEIGNKNIE